MIRVTRTKKPALLVDKEANWKKDIRSASTDAARKNAQDKYKHDDIKEALIDMFHGKCAYCESDITHIDYGHIEHFKPKGTPAYYELAVEWDNLLLACAAAMERRTKGQNSHSQIKVGRSLIRLRRSRPNIYALILTLG